MSRWLCWPSRAQDIRSQHPAQGEELSQSGGPSCSPSNESVYPSCPVWESCLEELPGWSEEVLPGHLSGPTVHIMGFPKESDGPQGPAGILPSPGTEHWPVNVIQPVLPAQPP